MGRMGTLVAEHICRCVLADRTVVWSCMERPEKCACVEIRKIDLSEVCGGNFPLSRRFFVFF
jgi:hypothetical protein